MDKQSTTSTPILKLVRERLIPWTEQPDISRLLLAQQAQHELNLPVARRVSPAPPLGPCTTYRGPHHTEKSSIWIARWPECGQETLRVPMMWCVMSGEADFRLGEYILHCKTGDILLIPAGVPHAYGARPALEGEKRKTGSCDILMLSPRGRQIQCWMARSRGERFIGASAGENLCLLETSLTDYLERIVQELQSEGAHARRIANNLLMIFFLVLEREMAENRFLTIGTSFEMQSSLSDGYDSIESAQQYIKSHLHKPLTLENVARAVYMSRTQFAKQFKEQVGTTFGDYVIEQRLSRACRFLLETQWTISYVSRFVGFKSPSYFHRLFVREKKISPAEYRRKFSFVTEKRNGHDKAVV